MEDGHDGRAEDDDEQRREDHEDEREEHLDRRLLRLLLDRRPAPLAHLDREAAQDLPDRYAEELALHHRAGERLDGRRRAAPGHVLERLHRCEPHALLLEHDAQLVAQRALHPAGAPRAGCYRIDRGMPELIDLLVVTVEAGLSLSAALQLAGERMKGPLGDELRIVLQEQRMGLTPVQALENMVGRCPTPAVESFTRAMMQGQLLGVSVGQILRSLAIEMRKRRRAAAEQQAQKAPIKMLFPLVFMIFPALFVVILGPAVVSVFQALKHG